jgi:Na+/H+ antiporter NhaC
MLSLLFMALAALSVAVGGISRLANTTLKSIPPQSFLELTVVFLLFSIAASLHRKE